MTRQAIQNEAALDEARSFAGKQIREQFKCETCGLEFTGSLAFASHNEETSHMKNQTGFASISNYSGQDSAYRGFVGSY